MRLRTATELAVKYADFSLEIVKRSGQKAKFPPYAWLIYEFHRQLSNLMKYGALPADSQEEMQKYLREVGAA